MSLRVLAIATTAASLVLAGCTPAAKARVSPPEYVSLGDSYTSGPGIPVPVGIPGCMRSDHDYPSLVASAIGARPFRDASCSGATTAHMTAPQVTGNGTNPPQLDALGPKTTVVSIEIGGNDIGFGEIATRCSSPFPTGAPCQRQFVVSGGDVVDDRIAVTKGKLGVVLAAIHQRSPRARVLVVGYPGIVPTTGPGCWPQVPVTATDVAYLRAKLEGFNAAIAEIASAGRATYVDLAHPSAGHDACQSPAVRWVEPLLPAIPAFALHPNSAGMAAMAAVVAAAARAGP